MYGIGSSECAAIVSQFVRYFTRAAIAASLFAIFFRVLVRLFILLLLTTSLLAQRQNVQGPFSGATNISLDIEGTIDQRSGTWGTAGAVTTPIRFNPPMGYRTRIIHVDGDVMAWPIVNDGDTPVRRGQVAGVLFGLQTSAAEGSTRATPWADNCFQYVQVALSRDPVRAAFSRDTRVVGLLQAENVMNLKIAVFLNQLGKKIHIEVTLLADYVWERE